MSGIEREVDEGVRGHVIELLEAHLQEMRAEGAQCDLSQLDHAWRAFKDRISQGNFQHTDVDEALDRIYNQHLKSQ